MFEILDDTQGRRIYVKAKGRLTDEDYKELTPRLESALKEFGPLRLYVDMEDFEGWTLGAAWDDFSFGLKHWNDFERIALIGDKPWEEVSMKMMDKMMSGQARYFDIDKKAEARTWIEDS